MTTDPAPDDRADPTRADGSRFILDFGTLRLPDDLAARVDGEMRGAGLRALADLVSGGTRAYNDSYFASLPVDGIGGAVWVPGTGEGTTEPWPPGWMVAAAGSVDGPAALTLADHTLVIAAIMDHAVAITRYLPAGSGRPSDEDVLRATLDVHAIDDRVKSRVRAMLELLPEVRRGIDGLDPRLADNIRTAISAVSGLPARDGADQLKASIPAGAADGSDPLRVAVAVAAEIFADGADTIYRPQHPFYQLLMEGPGGATNDKLITETLQVDGVGAALGGAAGVLVGGVGAVPGAAVGAGGASGGYLVGTAIAWLTS